jgi:hypothetical protein
MLWALSVTLAFRMEPRFKESTEASIIPGGGWMPNSVPPIP